MTLTCMRWAVALVPILVAARPSLRRDWPALRARWLYLATMGAAGYTAFVALFYVAAHSTSALNLSIIQGAIPALVLIGARLFLGLRFTALQALGAMITMLGVAAIASQGDPARLAALAFNSGDVMMVVAAVLYAGYTVGLRERPNVSGLSMLAAMAFAAFVTSVPLMIWEMLSGGFVWPTAGGLLALAYVWRSARRSLRKYSSCAGSSSSGRAGRECLSIWCRCSGRSWRWRYSASRSPPITSSR
jgi:drug/metabolite transporter (DMT)-like permease